MRFRGYYLIGLGLVGVSLGLQAHEATVDSWEQKMIVRDRIPKEDNRLLDLFGFSMSNGDVLIEIDQVNRQILSISGSLHHVDEDVFKILQNRLSAKPLEGWSLHEDTDHQDGETDHMIKLDLKNLKLTFSEEFVWTVRNSESLDLKVSLEKLGQKHVALSLEMNLGDSMNPRLTNMILVNDVKI